MPCQTCKSQRIAHVNGKTSDMCDIDVPGKSSNDYVPRDMGIGGGDYICFAYCLDCGQIQGKFPLPPSALEQP